MIFVPAGVYSIAATLLIGDHVALLGEALYSSRFVAAPGLNGHVLTNADKVTGNTGITLRNVAFDANGANQTAEVNAVDLTRVRHSLIDNIEATGGRRNAMGGTGGEGTNGEGLCLRRCEYNEIRGGYFHHNDYDGIKLRTSHFNRITGPRCVDNGRSGCQLAYERDGVAQEGVEADGSNHNLLDGVIVTHSTGSPHQFAPTTSGVYLHTASRNVIRGLQVHGLRQGVGVYAGSVDNMFEGGNIRARASDVAAIQVGGGPGTTARNIFRGFTLRGLAGADGQHVRVTSGATLTRFYDCAFARGDGTGTWVINVAAGALSTHFYDTYVPLTAGQADLVDAGTSTLFTGYGMSGRYELTGPIVLKASPTIQSGDAPAGSGVFFVSSTDGALKFKGPSGTVTTIAPA